MKSTLNDIDWQTPWDEMDAIFPHEPAPEQPYADDEPLDGPYLDGDALVACPPDYIRDEEP